MLLLSSPRVSDQGPHVQNDRHAADAARLRNGVVLGHPVALRLVAQRPNAPGRPRFECHKASNKRLQIVQPSENRQDTTKDHQKHRDCILLSDKDFLMI